MSEVSTVSVNGEWHEITTELSLLDALPLWGFVQTAGVVVAVNQQFVAREDWMQTQLNNGDQIDVLQAVVGG